jgi:hypothetical protein
MEKDAMMGLIGLMGLKGPVTTHYNIIATLLQLRCIMLYHVVSCCILLRSVGFFILSPLVAQCFPVAQCFSNAPGAIHKHSCVLWKHAPWPW